MAHQAHLERYFQQPVAVVAVPATRKAILVVLLAATVRT
jgi:hypothetical protein